MRWYRPLPAVLGVLLLVAIAVSDGQENKGAKAKTPNYYPIAVGNTWQFKVSANGKDAKVTTTIAKHDNINGEVLARLESPNASVTEHLSQTEKGVFRHRFNGAEVTPPFRLFPYPPKVGTKWKGEFVVQGDKGKHLYEGEIQGEETVEVPAGKFKTVRVQIKLEENGQQIETVYWFAKDIGFVKQTFQTGAQIILLQMEKFQPGK